MILPALRTGVKQGHRCASERIAGSDRRRFAEVAAGTGQTEVLGYIAPMGINMLNVHGLTNRVTACLAVFAAIPCTFVDEPYDGGPGQFIHQWRRAPPRSPDSPVRSARQRLELFGRLTAVPGPQGLLVLPAAYQ